MLREAFVQANIVGGRIVLQSPTRYTTRRMNRSGGGVSERLTIRDDLQGLSLEYVCDAKDRQTVVSLSASRRLILRQLPRNDSKVETAEYVQSEQGEIVWTVGAGADKKRWVAANVWFLFFQEPESCKKHLVPLLRSLPMDMDLEAAAAQTEALLLTPPRSDDVVERRRAAEWVKQLGDDRFSVREAADRRLRKMGRDVVPFLRRLDRTQLDAEQQYRVQRILEAATGEELRDRPESLAGVLRGDPETWLLFMARDSEATRSLAKRHLERYWGEPVAFDPAAAPAVRSQQLERLREMLRR